MQVINNQQDRMFPVVSFQRNICNSRHRLDLYTFKSKDFKYLTSKGVLSLSPDELNPRYQSKYNAMSNADLDAQIIKHGQISPAIGRYLLSSEGKIQFDDNGYPIIGILDGSRRFDCCVRNDTDFTIEVGEFDEEIASYVVEACVDSQQDLSSLELGILIGDLESKAGNKLKEKELKELLPYQKSKTAISNARKAQRLHTQYPKLFKVFPVISLVGKTTISKLDKIVTWAEDNFQMETLLTFCGSELFDYELVQDEPLFSEEELQNFNAKSNNLIFEAMRERLGIPLLTPNRKVLTSINEFVDYELKMNNKETPKTEKLVVYEAQLTDEQRSITQKFFEVLHDPKLVKGNQDISLSRRFDLLFRQLI